MDVLNPKECEWGIIGIFAAENGGKVPAAVVERLYPEDFANHRAAQAWRAITTIRRAKEPVTMERMDIELTKTLGETDAVRVMKDVLYAAQELGFTSANAKSFVDAIKEGARRRHMVDLSNRLRAAAETAEGDLDETVETVRLEMRKSRADDGRWENGLDTVLTAWEDASTEHNPIVTGFAELDDVLCGGLVKPELTIVGARPGKGKSAFLLAAAMNAVKAGHHVAYISLEMSAIQIGQRMLSRASAVSVSKMRRGGKYLSDGDWDVMNDGLVVLGEQGISERMHVLATYGMTVEQLFSAAQYMKDRGELDLLVVDYIQLLKMNARMRTDFERISAVSKGLKELALGLDVPVLTAAQVRRQDNMGGAGRAPGLSELRGSGDLEQDADNVLLIHIPENGNDATLQDAENQGHGGIWQRSIEKGRRPFTVEVAKQRQGANGRAWFQFQPRTMSFYGD